MYFTSITVALAAIGVVTAVPTPDELSVNTFTKSFVDKFDNLRVLPASTPVTNQVGHYGALNYIDFSAASSQTSPGRLPPSRPNFIFGSDLNNVQLVPANSSVLHFTLQSLYYACSPLVGGAVGASQDCTIQVAGRKAAQFGGTTAVKELVYSSAVVNGAFQQATFAAKDFSGLVQVTVNVIGGTVTSDTPSPNFDNVAYVATFQ